MLILKVERTSDRGQFVAADGVRVAAGNPGWLMDDWFVASAAALTCASTGRLRSSIQGSLCWLWYVQYITGRHLELARGPLSTDIL